MHGQYCTGVAEALDMTLGMKTNVSQLYCFKFVHHLRTLLLLVLVKRPL